MTLLTQIAPQQATGDLIDLILTRYHAVHRADLAELVPLARKVEAVHADDPAAPRGLARALTRLCDELEDHMAKEEMILFPAMRAGGAAGIAHPIAMMRADHDDHADGIAAIRRLTGNLVAPPDACGSWCALYAGVSRLFDDLAAHIALENDVLFPRFAPAP
jgi:regulator of cell morphogenesis and NO signaling